MRIKKGLVMQKKLDLLNFLEEIWVVLAKNEPFLGDLRSFEEENRNWGDLKRFEEAWEPWMWYPLGPTLANAFLFHYENEWLNSFPIELKHKFYKRYVDDIFVMF